MGRLQRPAEHQVSPGNRNGDDHSDDNRDREVQTLISTLSVSQDMKDKLVNVLAGDNKENRKLIRSAIGQGRCNARRSFTRPTLHKNSEQVFGRLKGYQQAGIQWLFALHNNSRNGIIADEMGLGKTAQTCVFLNDLYARELLDEPSIVVCPAGLIDNWCEELTRWAPSLRHLKFHGSQRERLALIEEYDSAEEDTHVLVTSLQTSTSQWDRSMLFKHVEFAYLIVDEAHYLKNAESQIYQKLQKKISAKRRLLLTGSPIQNQISELRNLLLFIMNDVFTAKSLDSSLVAYEKYRRIKSINLGLTPVSVRRDEGSPTGHDPNNTPSHNHQRQQHSSSSASPAILNDPFLLKDGSPDGKAITQDDHSSKQGDSQRERSSVAINGEDDVDASDIECMQRLLAPFILRRLKQEVLSDLPKKHGHIVRCQMQGVQREMYLSHLNNVRVSLSNRASSSHQKKRNTASLTKTETTSSATSDAGPPQRAEVESDKDDDHDHDDSRRLATTGEAARRRKRRRLGPLPTDSEMVTPPLSPLPLGKSCSERSSPISEIKDVCRSSASSLAPPTNGREAKSSSRQRIAKEEADGNHQYSDDDGKGASLSPPNSAAIEEEVSALSSTRRRKRPHDSNSANGPEDDSAPITTDDSNSKLDEGGDRDEGGGKKETGTRRRRAAAGRYQKSTANVNSPNAKSTPAASSSDEAHQLSASAVGGKRRGSPATTSSKSSAMSSSTAKSSRGTGGYSAAFVKATIFRLRRICNHPLLMQEYFGEKLRQELVDVCCTNRIPFFSGEDRSRIGDSVDAWSDMEVHAFVREQLADLVGDGDGNLDLEVSGKRYKELDKLDKKNFAILKKLVIPPEGFLSSAKVGKMLGILDELENEKRKSLIFSQFTQYLDVIQEVLRIHRPHLKFMRLDGNTQVRDRQDLVRSFADDASITVFMLSTKAGGVGLNLTPASAVILMDQDWNPHNDRQAEDRVHRLGQERDVDVYRLCCRDTIEESILKCCKRKLDLDSAFGGSNEDFLSIAILEDCVDDDPDDDEDDEQDSNDDDRKEHRTPPTAIPPLPTADGVGDLTG